MLIYPHNFDLDVMTAVCKEFEASMIIKNATVKK
jgi:hypothetical protein